MTPEQELLFVARRLQPADGYIRPDMPDDEQVNLVTTVGALRMLAGAIARCEGAKHDTP